MVEIPRSEWDELIVLLYEALRSESYEAMERWVAFQRLFSATRKKMREKNECH